jgi:hypothetical protein
MSETDQSRVGIATILTQVEIAPIDPPPITRTKVLLPRVFQSAQKSASLISTVRDFETEGGDEPRRPNPASNYIRKIVEVRGRITSVRFKKVVF